MNYEQRPNPRLRVERGIYQQPNGKYAVCFMVDGRPCFRTVGYDVEPWPPKKAAMASTRLALSSGSLPRRYRLRRIRLSCGHRLDSCRPDESSLVVSGTPSCSHSGSSPNT